MQSEAMKPACGTFEGELPAPCASLAYPYIPIQNRNPARYESVEALGSGTLFPGLNLPFKEAVKSKMPKLSNEAAELMALDFAVDELGLYLTTHADDNEALELYWNYIRLAREGREKYRKLFGPLMQTDITEGGYKWLRDPWPWEAEGSVK